MYQVFLNDIYAQWLEEFDREAAIKRQLPRRSDDDSRRRPRLLSLWRERKGARTGAPLARPYSQASQCS